MGIGSRGGEAAIVWVRFWLRTRTGTAPAQRSSGQPKRSSRFKQPKATAKQTVALFAITVQPGLSTRSSLETVLISTHRSTAREEAVPEKERALPPSRLRTLRREVTTRIRRTTSHARRLSHLPGRRCRVSLEYPWSSPPIGELVATPCDALRSGHPRYSVTFFA